MTVFAVSGSSVRGTGTLVLPPWSQHCRERAFDVHSIRVTVLCHAVHSVYLWEISALYFLSYIFLCCCLCLQWCFWTQGDALCSSQLLCYLTLESLLYAASSNIRMGLSLLHFTISLKAETTHTQNLKSKN